MSEESDRSRNPYSASGETEHYIKKLAFHLLTNGVILVQLQTLHYHLYMFDRLWKPKSRSYSNVEQQKWRVWLDSIGSEVKNQLRMIENETSDVDTTEQT